VRDTCGAVSLRPKLQAVAWWCLLCLFGGAGHGTSGVGPGGREPRKTWDEIKDQPPQTANTRGRPAKRQAKEPGERKRSRSAAEKPEKGDENKDAIEVEKTQLDSQTQPEATDKQSSKSTSQSLGNLTEALTQNWTLADQGGCGDCGYRALIDLSLSNHW
jgi:hypothetical protein